MLFIGFVVRVAVFYGVEQTLARKVAQSEKMAANFAPAWPHVLGASAPYKFASQLTPGPYALYRPAAPVNPLPPTDVSPVVNRIETAEPVIFITIDDGVYPHDKALQVLERRGVAATLFLNDANIHRHYDYFKMWQASGSTIQNHTAGHRYLPRLTPEAQQAEICHNQHRLTELYGREPTLFRAPYGAFNEFTRRVVASCHMKAVVGWSAVVENGAIHLQGVPSLRPGDIVLLHFTPLLEHDLNVLLDVAQSAGLHIGQLEDWIK